jgi:glycosyltransferase involved in cell wall biosynthesis
MAVSEQVTVVMPSFNAAPFIGAALRSISQQQMATIRVIVADTGSTDASRDIIAESSEGLAISVLELDRGSSPARARNAALSQIEGGLVAFLDADDLWPTGKLDRQCAVLAERQSLGMVSGYVRYFDIADATGLRPAANARTSDIVHVHLGACVYRHETLRRLGGFDEELHYAEDVDLMLRLRESGIGLAFLRTVELYYRKHAGAMTARDNVRQASDFRRATLKSLQRRRRAGLEASPLPDLVEYLVP